MDEILVANGNLSKSSWGCILIFQPLPVCTVLTLFVLLKSNNNKLTQLFLVFKKNKITELVLYDCPMLERLA